MNIYSLTMSVTCKSWRFQYQSGLIFSLHVGAHLTVNDIHDESKHACKTPSTLKKSCCSQWCDFLTRFKDFRAADMLDLQETAGNDIMMKSALENKLQINYLSLIPKGNQCYSSNFTFNKIQKQWCKKTNTINVKLYTITK